jgi:hypothetical protein
MFLIGLPPTLPPSSRGEGDGGGVRFLLEFDTLDNYLLIELTGRR